MQQIETEVLVIGAGPCGLMLANELGQRGIRAIVADREATVATAPQANATQARTMEHYRRLGFAHEIRQLGLPSDYPTDVAYFTTYAGYELGRHRMPPSGQADAFVRENAHIWNAAELPHRIPQSLIEQTLLRKAQELDTISVEFNSSRSTCSTHLASGSICRATGGPAIAEPATRTNPQPNPVYMP